VLHVLQDFPATRQVPVVRLTGTPALDEAQPSSLIESRQVV